MQTTAYLSLGSNIGEREENLRTAIAKLAPFGDVVRTSSFYETEPVEFLDQPWFLNCAVELQTSLDPHQLLDALLGIEESMGRKRIQPKGPRLIDLDILLYGALTLQDAALTIPHPAMHERRFVLEPLAEIAPHAIHPTSNKTVSELLNALPSGSPLVKKHSSDSDRQ